MTKEEAIAELKRDIELENDFTEDYINAVKMAIEALEQEPCEDAVSRQSVIDCFKKWQPYMATRLHEFENELFELPSVNPQKPKTGHWITWKEADNEIPSETRFECSVCHDAAQTLCNGLDLLSSYCPNCGAKMVEPKESEE